MFNALEMDKKDTLTLREFLELVKDRKKNYSNSDILNYIYSLVKENLVESGKKQEERLRKAYLRDYSGYSYSLDVDLMQVADKFKVFKKSEIIEIIEEEETTLRSEIEKIIRGFIGEDVIDILTYTTNFDISISHREYLVVSFDMEFKKIL